MSLEDFKEYLDMIVEKAFNEGVYWAINGTVSKEKAIKDAQDEILELKFKR